MRAVFVILVVGIAALLWPCHADEQVDSLLSLRELKKKKKKGKSKEGKKKVPSFEHPQELVNLTSGLSWSNLAWGFEQPGKDVIKGSQLLLVDPDEVTSDQVRTWKENGQVVICYLSVGTIEGWRRDYHEERKAWDALSLGKMTTWDESWVDFRNLKEIIPLVEKRVIKLRTKGCDGMEPDNIDCYDNTDCWRNMKGVKRGSDVKEAQIRYVKALAEMVHSYNLTMFAKNAVSILPTIYTDVNGVIAENCLKYSECGPYKKWFHENDKPFLAVEYDGSKSICKKSIEGMMGKHCKANAGNYLCKSSFKRWKNCFKEGKGTAKPARKLNRAIKQHMASVLEKKVDTHRALKQQKQQKTKNADLVLLEAATSFANRAWGYPNGGSDSVDGMKMVLIDPDYTAKSKVEELKAQGHLIMCYVSVGTIEGFRQDYKANPEAWRELALGKMTVWDESWIDIRKTDKVIALMADRFQRAADLGCEGIEPDNLDCYQSRECTNGMGGISREQAKLIQLKYLALLAEEAHNRNLVIVQKNVAELAEILSETFDGAVTENCLKWNECAPFKTFYTDKGKAHFATEYSDSRSRCRDSYVGMMTKTCKGNSGGYLCVDEEWTECFQPDSKLPLTRYRGDAPRDEIPNEDEPIVLPLPCIEEGQGGIVKLEAKKKLVKFKQVVTKTTCLLFESSNLQPVRMRLKTLEETEGKLSIFQIGEFSTDETEISLFKKITQQGRKRKNFLRIKAGKVLSNLLVIVEPSEEGALVSGKYRN